MGMIRDPEPELRRREQRARRCAAACATGGAAAWAILGRAAPRPISRAAPRPARAAPSGGAMHSALPRGTLAAGRGGAVPPAGGVQPARGHSRDGPPSSSGHASTLPSGQQKGPRAPAERVPVLLVAARHLAFHALDVEVDAAQELVVGDRVLGQHFLAGVVDDRALPDREAAVLQAGLHLLDASSWRRPARRPRADTMSIAPSLTPHQVWPVVHVPSSASRTALM